MSTKPSDVATWSTTGPITVPNAGKKAAGFVPGERPGAQHLNYLHNLAGLWQQYLSDGALSGDHSIAGNLTLSANKDVTISGTGRFKHGKRTLLIPASTGKLNQDSGSALTIDNGRVDTNGTTVLNLSGTATLKWMIPIPLDSAWVPTVIRANVIDNATGTTTVSMFVNYLGTDASTTAQETAATSSGAGSVQTLTKTLTMFDDVDTHGMVAAVVTVTFTCSALHQCSINWIEVDYSAL